MFQLVFRAVIEQFNRGPARKLLVSVEFPAVSSPRQPTFPALQIRSGRLETLRKPVIPALGTQRFPSETLLKPAGNKAEIH